MTRKTIYFPINVEHIVPAMEAEAEKTGRGLGYIIAEAYARTRGIKCPPFAKRNHNKIKAAKNK